jgi:hypothetical protein
MENFDFSEHDLFHDKLAGNDYNKLAGNDYGWETQG